MKRFISIAILLIMLFTLAFCSGCGDPKDDVFIPNADLRKSAEDILASLGSDRRITEYLKLRPSLTLRPKVPSREILWHAICGTRS